MERFLRPLCCLVKNVDTFLLDSGIGYFCKHFNSKENEMNL